jgi:hypothetical protein
MKAVSRSYDSYEQARAAVDAIEKAGIPSADVSLIANEHVLAGSANGEAVADTATGAGIGGVVGGGAGLLAGLGLLAIPGLGPVVAAGWLAATAVGAAAGATTGGLVAALIDAGVDDEQAASLSDSVRRGSTLVTVRVPDDEVGRIEGLLSIHRPPDRPSDIAAPAQRPGESERERRRREWRDEGMGKQA